MFDTDAHGNPLPDGATENSPSPGTTRNTGVPGTTPSSAPQPKGR